MHRNRNLWLGLLALVILLPRLASGESLRPEPVEGQIVRMQVGLDSGRVWIRAASRVVECARTPSLEWLPPDRHAEYTALVGRLPGNERLDLGDTFSTVRAWVIGPHLLKYEVLARPPQLWGVIIASEPTFERANQVQIEALSAGFEEAGVIESGRYSRLRPGYYVAVAAVFSDQASANRCLAKARGRWRDAYLRRIL